MDDVKSLEVRLSPMNFHGRQNFDHVISSRATAAIVTCPAGRPLKTSSTAPGTLGRSPSPKRKGVKRVLAENERWGLRRKKSRCASPPPKKSNIRRVKLNLNLPEPILAGADPSLRVAPPSRTNQAPNDTSQATPIGKKASRDEKRDDNGIVGVTNKKGGECKKRKDGRKDTDKEQQKKAKPKKERSRKTGSPEFSVNMPLNDVSKLDGRSVSGNFEEQDLVCNGIKKLPREVSTITSASKILTKPIYFEKRCEPRLALMKDRLNGDPVCLQLRAVTQDEYNNVKDQEGGRLPRLLRMKTLAAINRGIKNNRAPREGDSGQNGGYTIKALLEPVIRTLKQKEIHISQEFHWKDQHKIQLLSLTDLSKHEYKPISDVAITREIDGEGSPLIIFEVHSKPRRRVKGEEPADKVRLLIQGAALAGRKEDTTTVFYLNENNEMETIVIYTDKEKGTTYCVDQKPFYTEATSLDLICKIVNLI